MNFMSNIQLARPPLLRSVEMSGRCNGATVYVYRADKCPSGTFKDIRCAALIEERLSKPTVFVHVTCGNSGYSLGQIVQQSEKVSDQLKVVNIVDRNTPKLIKERLRTCSTVHEMDIAGRLLTSDEMRTIARQLTGFTGTDDNIIEVESYQLPSGYGTIIDDIYTSGITPTHVFCPIGGGELFTELINRALDVWKDNPPLVVGVTVPENVIAKSYFGSEITLLPKPKSNVADKLICAYTKFKDIVLNLLRTRKTELMVLTDQNKILRSYEWLNKIGIPVEPSAAVAFVGAEHYARRTEDEKDGIITSKDTVVIINTGKGLYDQAAVEKFWTKRILRGLKSFGIFLAGLAVAGMFLWYEISQRHRIEELYRGNLEKSAVSYITKSSGEYASIEELRIACRKIPGKKNCDDVYTLDSFTNCELLFYTNLMTWETYDFTKYDSIKSLRNSWETGKYKGDGTCANEELKPGWSTADLPWLKK